MKLAALKGGVRDLDVVVPGSEEGEDESVHVQYRPGELTLEVSEVMRGAIDAGIIERTVGIFLQKVLVSWDLEEDVLDEDGSQTTVPVPVTYEGLKKVPIPFLGLLMMAIGEDARPDPPTGSISSDTSPPKDSAEDAQNGITSFGLPSTTDASPGT